MADPSRAAHLIEEDAYSSRGIGYNELPAAAEERLLFDAERASSSEVTRDAAPPYWAKGKGRSEDGEDDEMAWEPPPTAEQARRRSLSGETQYQPPSSRQHGSTSSDHHRAGAGGATSSLDKRRIRLLWWKAAGINVLFICGWYTFSTCISVYNKWMFSAEHYDFPYPLFVTSCHMLIQWSLAGLTLLIFPSLKSPNRPAARDYGTKVLPCGMASGLDIGLSNLSLRTITLSFYTMCKSSSLAFVLLFAFLFKLEVPSWKLGGIIFIITAGVVLMVSTETQFDFAGMVEVLTASALGGLRWSLTQILLDKESMGMSNPIATLFWLAPIMGVTLATFSMAWDGWGNVFSNEVFFGSFGKALSTFGAILFPGFLAFCMNVTEFGLIQRTSVVTLSVAGIFKEVAVIFLSTFIFHDVLTPINISGLCVTIFGIGLYNYLKYRQFTNDPSSMKGHGHGRRQSVQPSAAGFAPLAEDSYDEDAPMLSPRAREAAHRLGSRNDSAIFLDTIPSDYIAAPHHSLGDDDDSDSSSRSSVEIPSQSRNPYLDNPGGPESSLHLHKQTRLGKEQQHEHDRIEGLEERIHGTAGEGQELVELETREKAFEESLNRPPSADAETGWDLLGEMEANKGKKE